MSIATDQRTSRVLEAEPDESGPSRRRGLSLRAGAFMLLAGAVLQALGSQLHPKADADADFDGAIAGMLDDAAWYPSHVIELIALVLIVGALWSILRTETVQTSRSLRLSVAAVLVGTVVLAVDSVPHTLSAVELDELRAGEATPLLDAHLWLQAIGTPILGVGVALLAVVDAMRSPRWTWFVAALAVIGGVVGGAAGPLLLITANARFGELFIGFAGLGIWLLVTAIRRVRAVRASRPVALT